jgi:hypothetical protein
VLAVSVIITIVIRSDIIKVMDHQPPRDGWR